MHTRISTAMDNVLETSDAVSCNISSNSFLSSRFVNASTINCRYACVGRKGDVMSKWYINGEMEMVKMRWDGLSWERGVNTYL